MIKVKGKVIIVSDIHGNISTLKYVLDFSKKNDINQIISLGDYIDYNIHNNEVLSEILLNKQIIIALRGNHEAIVEYLNKDELSSILSYKKIHTKLIKQALKLPDQVIIQLENGKNILLCHSTPDNNHFIYLEEKYTELIDGYLEKLPYDGFWYGHTHFHHFYQKEDKHIFNPGSLGQNRNQNSSQKNFVTFGILDSSLNEYSILGLPIKDNDPTQINGEAFTITNYHFR